MYPPPDAREVASALLSQKGLHLQSLKVLQSLWAGYGQICRLTATPDSSSSSASTSRTSSTTSTPQETHSYILKLITPPPSRSKNDEGHLRKILSYQVEQYFYTHLAPQMPASIPVAKALSSISEPRPDGTISMAMILNDLKQDYPIAGEKRNVLTPTQVDAALDWLASFHGFWWSRVKDFNHSSLVLPPLQEAAAVKSNPGSETKTVWLNGGYTYLATRQTEYAALTSDHDSEWNTLLTGWEEDTYSISHFAAAVLSPPRKRGAATPTAPYMTLIHGDVKSENLFSSRAGTEVVFYDFQYTGLGLGVCDLAKLFTCSVPLDLLLAGTKFTAANLPRELQMQSGERALLERYWTRLKRDSGLAYEWGLFVRHWETALVDWLRFQASWGFWGNTEWLEARVRWILKDEKWRDEVMSAARMGGLEGLGEW